MGILTSELERLLYETNVPAAESGGFSIVSSAGVQQIHPAPPAGYFDVVIISFVNEAADDISVDDLLAFGGLSFGFIGSFSQYNSGVFPFPLVIRPEDGPISLDLSSVGPVNLHMSISAYRIPLGNGILEPVVVPITTLGEPGQKLFDGPVEPGRTRVLQTLITTINAFVPGALLLNLDSQSHDVRSACSPDNGVTLVTGERKTVASQAPDVIVKLGPIGNGESAWASIAANTITAPVIVNGLARERPAP
jgi:hypothetical protein